MIARDTGIDQWILRGASLLPVVADPGTSFSLRRVEGSGFPFPFHYHPEVELTYIRRGRGRRVIGEVVQPFREGDLVLVGSMLPHAWISDSGSKSVDAYVLRFDRSRLERALSQVPEAGGVLQWLGRAERGLKWEGGFPEDPGFARILAAPSPARRLPAVLDLLFALADGGGWMEICGDISRGLVRGSSEQRVGYAVRYLLEHFDESLPQATVARRVGMQSSAFSRLFRRVTGQTFQESLLRLRIQHACRLLVATNLSVAEVCFASGFGNLSNFNKQFLALQNQSPRAFRAGARQADGAILPPYREAEHDNLGG